MSIFESIKMAFSSIASNKMRSLLTMLGIIIGISAVITITTLGSTLRSTVKGAMDSLGMNLFYVYLIERDPEDPNSMTVSPDDAMTMDMLKELTDKYPGEIHIAMDTSAGDGTLTNSRTENVDVSVTGAFYGTFDYNGLKILSGRRLNMRDNMEKKYSCVVSDIFVRQYFKEKEEPIGKFIKVTMNNGVELEFNIVGVYKYNAMNQGSFDPNTKDKDKKTPLYIPYTIAQSLSTSRYGSNDYFFGAMLSYDISYDSDVVQEHITEFFKGKYAANKDYDIEILNAQDDVQMIDMVISILTLIVSVIAAISLIVGGVGVMNIMLVSVTERTREIGIRKALGAKKSAIKTQFLIEAIIICLIGGGIGILIGLLNSELVGLIANMVVESEPDYQDILGRVQVTPSTNAIIISLVFSMLIGIFFGLYPAGKAAKMNPIDALRYD